MGNHLGPGCVNCQCQIGNFYTCRSQGCKNYSPPIINGRNQAKTPEVVGDVSIYGRYSDPKGVTKISRVKDLIGESFRTKLLISKKLKYAACFTGDIEYAEDPAGDHKIRVVSATGPIKVTYYEVIGDKWVLHKRTDIIQ